MTRLAIGLDLGTTHAALAYHPGDDGASVRAFPVPQLVAKGTLDSRGLLPSLVYFGHESDGPLSLPWDAACRHAVGEYARARAVEAPNRVVVSAKSWLSNAAVDPRSAFLPPTAPEDVQKVSPVEASRLYLEHLAKAWAHQPGGLGPLCEHDVVLTVPASFDAVARELTQEAAEHAGLGVATLLEEPQAALYGWIDAMGESWREHLTPGDVVLVVDIGGGTTDFSAIVAEESAGSLELRRVAVGDHILLGGDNMDLALAHTVRAKLKAQGKTIDAFQMSSLAHACRVAKEQLLGQDNVPSVPIVVASRGASLFGGSLRSDLLREEVEQLIIDGFFPSVQASARPLVRPKAALRQQGLPYASDPAITKHLAEFLGRQASALAGSADTTLLRPTKLLLNGGVVKSPAIRARLVQCLDAWLVADGAAKIAVLPGADPDLAVARGAAYFARAGQGRGIRIRGGTARAYYVGIESPMPAVPGMEPPTIALCVAPFGMEEGTAAELPPQELMVVVGEPVQFRFFGSSVRREDVAGSELEDWADGELSEMPPIAITLPAQGRQSGDFVPVQLRASVTAVGTLLLEAVPLEPLTEGECWKVEIGVRGEGEPMPDPPAP